MVSIRRGSTPTVAVRVTGCSLPSGSDVRMFVRSHSGTVTYGGDRIREFSTTGGISLVTLTLTQDETMDFDAGEMVDLQLKASEEGRTVMVSDIAHVAVKEVLDEQTM